MKKSTKLGIGLGAGLLTGAALYHTYDDMTGYNPGTEIMEVEGSYFKIDCNNYTEWTLSGGPKESSDLVADFTDIDGPSDISDEDRNEIVTYVVDFQNGHDKGTRFIMEQYFLPESCDIEPLED